MKLKFALLMVVLIGSLGAMSQLHAQNRISYGQVIEGLYQSEDSARKIGIDTQALRKEIEARIQSEGTDNASVAPPINKVLSRLPNFIVQVQFDLDSDVIRPESWVTVGRIADALHHPLLAGNRFLLVGNTDARGTRTYNLDLSERRALAVGEMLINVFRVPPRRVVAVGLGEERLFDGSDPFNSVNRRVEIYNIGPE